MKSILFGLNIILLIIVFSATGFAQDRTVKGVVTAFDSIAIHGAAIQAKGTKQTVTSDSLGNFSILCKNNDKLKVSANGFFNQNVNIEEGINYAAVNLQLKAGAKNLEMATAFTSVSDRDKLTALASKSAEELDLSVYSNIFDAIQGKFPGLQVQGTNLIIRGTGSISGPSPALIVLDGVVVESATLNALNPSTVKSINVIKDGSSAVYGSRAAFGVVEITTKKGGDMN